MGFHGLILPPLIYSILLLTPSLTLFNSSINIVYAPPPRVPLCFLVLSFFDVCSSFLLPVNFFLLLFGFLFWWLPISFLLGFPSLVAHWVHYFYSVCIYVFNPLVSSISSYHHISNFHHYEHYDQWASMGNHVSKNLPSQTLLYWHQWQPRLTQTTF